MVEVGVQTIERGLERGSRRATSSTYINVYHLSDATCVCCKGLAILLLLAVAAVLAVRAYVSSSLPQLDGTVPVSGISGPVDIIRDRDAITHVFAATRLDTFYGLGYAHAQDRLWQMEFQRRVGHGRLSEVFGAAHRRRRIGFSARSARAAPRARPGTRCRLTRRTR